MQPQPLFAFLQSEAGSDNKQDKTKSCKQTSKPRGGIIVSKIGKYIVSFLFDSKSLKLSLVN